MMNMAHLNFSHMQQLIVFNVNRYFFFTFIILFNRK